MKQAIWKVDWHSKVVLTTVITVSLAGLLALYVNANPLREADKEFMFAQSLYEKGKFDLATVQFQKFIEIFPANINCNRAQYLLGTCFWNQVKYEEAISAFDRLVEEYLQSDLVAPSPYSLGYIYVEQKDYEESLWAFRRLRVFPEFNKTFEVCYIIAKILYENKKYPEAISEYSIPTLFQNIDLAPIWKEDWLISQTKTTVKLGMALLQWEYFSGWDYLTWISIKR